MEAENTVKWLFLDLNSYFASVEQQLRPELRGRPVAVVPMMTDFTCAIAASYEAKAYGIKTGTNVAEAKRMCPKLACVLARHDKYVEYHHRIIEEAIRHVPINRVWSIDELSSRLPPRQRNPQAAREVAQRLKEGIKKNVGEMIRCSVGIAPNSFLAKVATDMQKPDGLVVLDPHELPGRLLKLKLRDLPGINVNMERRLNEAGIRSVEHLWHMSPKHARQIWGNVGGERFWYNLRGFDIPDTETSTSTIGHSRMLDPGLRSPEAARLVARRLTVKAATRLRRKDFYATQLYTSIRDVEDHRWAAEARLQPVQDNFSFLEALDAMWTAMLSELNPWKLKKVSVVIHGLRRRGEITPDLFDTISPTRQKQSRRYEALSRIMDSVNEKYGAETLRLGVSPQTSAGYVGTKIAFSRIPDMEEFHE